MKMQVYTKARGARTLKPGAFENYRAKYPDAIKVQIPSLRTLEKWSNDCGCRAIDGCWTEPDGYCNHGYPSWLLALNYI